jgi:hypothetical protein
MPRVGTRCAAALSNMDTVRVGIGALRVPDRCVVVKNGFTG